MPMYGLLLLLSWEFLGLAFVVILVCFRPSTYPIQYTTTQL